MNPQLPPPREPNRIRKSAYGRTQLFLPSSSAILREVKCMGGITRRDVASVYHLLPELYTRANAQTLCCWHCCETIDSAECLIPLPKVYDHNERLFHVYGATCSPGCAKAYILEHTTFDRGQHLNVLAKMLRDVYNVSDPVIATPPRASLRRFGGVFDPRRQTKAECRVVEPPFVSYCMLVDERMHHHSHATVEHGVGRRETGPGGDVEMGGVVEDADTFDEPQSPALFDEYLEQQQQHTDDPGPRRAPVKRKRGGGGDDRDVETDAPKGPLSRFVK